MDLPGIEPGAFRMQSERDTPTPQTQGYLFSFCSAIYSNFRLIKWNLENELSKMTLCKIWKESTLFRRMLILKKDHMMQMILKVRIKSKWNSKTKSQNPLHLFDWFEKRLRLTLSFEQRVLTILKLARWRCHKKTDSRLRSMLTISMH